MNGRGNMTPSNTQYPNSYINDGGKRTGASSSSSRSLLPPISPHSRIPLTRLPAGSPYFSTGPRSMTQPPVLSSLGTPWSSFRDSVPPVNPPPSSFRYDSSPPVSSSPSSVRRDSLPPVSPSVSSFRRDSLPPVNHSPSSFRESFPPSPSTFSDSLSPLFRDSPSTPMEKTPSFPPPVPFTRRQYSAGSKTLPSESIYPALPELLVGEQSCNNEGVGDDGEAMEKHCTTEFFNLDNNNASYDNENGDDEMINVSDWEGEITANERRSKTGSSTSGVKRRARKEIEPLRKHYRSVSMDSCFTESLNQPPPPPRNLPGKVSSSNSVDGNKTAFSGEYTAYELKMIAGSTKRTEIASNPKRVKRILANREAVARSNQRKARYIVDLENRVDKLKNDTTSLSMKVELLENDKTMLTNEKKELKLRVESLEQQAKLRDALTEQLRAEFQPLKAIYMSIQSRGQFDRTNMESLDPNMFQQQLNINQFNQPPQQQLNINQFNQPQTNPLNINQFNKPQMNPDFYGH